MGGAMARGLNGLMEQYLAACVLLAQVILSVIGVGEVSAVSALGLLLCLVGLTQRSAQADLWVLVPLILYSLLCFASTYAAHGNFIDGYGPLHAIFPALYLLLACLRGGELLALKRLCAAWAGIAALWGVVQFVWQAAVRGQTARLSGVLGNANPMGIFLVIGWFLLLSCRAQGDTKPWTFLPALEPVILIALALTLSLGSFAAMAAGILVLLMEKKRRASWRDALSYLCVLLAKAGLGVGTGILLYLAAAWTGAAWLCLPLLLYGVALAVLWRRYESALEAFPRLAAGISILGLAVAVTAVVIRPSALSTFAERLEMMKSALPYFTANPLLGIGPYQWRLSDLQDGGTYFGTWHIHNVPLHVGVETGWLAMVLLLFVALRFYRKGPEAYTKAGISAFFLHNLMDTSFFYLGITSLALILAGRPQGKRLGGWAVRGIFALLAVVFAWSLLCCAAAGWEG